MPKPKVVIVVKTPVQKATVVVPVVPDIKKEKIPTIQIITQLPANEKSLSFNTKVIMGGVSIIVLLVLLIICLYTVNKNKV